MTKKRKFNHSNLNTIIVWVYELTGLVWTMFYFEALNFSLNFSKIINFWLKNLKVLLRRKSTINCVVCKPQKCCSTGLDTACKPVFFTIAPKLSFWIFDKFNLISGKKLQNCWMQRIIPICKSWQTNLYSRKVDNQKWIF